MRALNVIVLASAGYILMSCEVIYRGGPDRTVDRGFDSKPLSELKAGIWIDPNGCDHWIIDDGLEGYLSQRLDRSGKPVCSGATLATGVIGEYRRGSIFPDLI